MATRTTETPAAPMAFMSGAVEDEQAGERDADGEAGEEHGAPGAWPRCARPRRRPLADVSACAAAPGAAPAQLLTEPADDEQPVVDAQAEPEHGDDVDDRGVEVDDVGEAEQRGSAPPIAAIAPMIGMPGGDEAAEDEHHDEKADRQGDALADAQVRLDLVGDGVDEQANSAGACRSRRAPSPGPRRPHAGSGPIAASWAALSSPGSSVDGDQNRPGGRRRDRTSGAAAAGARGRRGRGRGTAPTRRR